MLENPVLDIECVSENDYPTAKVFSNDFADF
jgi:hypothetical protein